MRRRAHTALAVVAVTTLTVLATPVPAFADNIRDDQWYLDALNVEEAHTLSQGEGVTIGLIDTGVDSTHPDLKGSVEAGNSYGGVSGDGLQDEFDHGTGIASILVGRGHGDERSEGILGIAPKAKVVSVNAGCTAECQDTGDGIGDGIKWLADQDVDIISISMGDIPKAEDPIEYARSKEIPVVAIAGNLKAEVDGLGAIDVEGTWWPGTAKNVIPVSGTTRDGKFWEGSQSLIGAAVQPQLGLSAPATDLPAASSGGGYATHSGTSGSAPIVAGTLALIKSAYPDLTYNQWIDRLLDTVDDKGPKGFDDKFGWGIVNPHRALTEETTYEGKDGDQVSSPEDRLPLNQQGHAPADNSDGKASGEDSIRLSNSNSLLLLLVVAMAAVVAVAVGTAILINNKRKKRGYQKLPSIIVCY